MSNPTLSAKGPVLQGAMKSHHGGQKQVSNSKKVVRSLAVLAFATALGLGFARLDGGGALQVFVIGLGVAFAVNWLAFIVFSSAVVVLLVRSKISAINLLANTPEKKWANDPSRQAYRHETPILMPLLHKS